MGRKEEEMSKTEKNLLDAFSGESQANRRYLAFAKKADEEGFLHAAKLFRAAAEAETIHALNHLSALGGVKTTRENLTEAVSGETYEFQKMYPPMIEDAKTEGKKTAEKTLSYANEVEKTHAGLFKKALEDLGKQTGDDYYVCKVCGHTVEGEPPEKCPVCGSKKEMFKKID